MYATALRPIRVGHGCGRLLLAELLGRLAELQRASGQDRASRTTANTLIELAKRHGSADALLRAVRTLRVSPALAWLQNPTALDALETARWLTADRDTARQSQLFAYLSQIPPYAYDMAESKRLSSRSLELARQAQQTSILQEALRSRLYAPSGPTDLTEQLTVSDELLRMVEPQDPAGIVAQEAQLTRFLTFLQLGDMSRADEALAQMSRAARRSRVPEAIWHVDRLLATRALARGDCDAAERAFQQLEEARERLHLAYEDAFLQPQVVAILFERGELKYLAPSAPSVWPERASHDVFGVPRVFEIAWVAGLAKCGELSHARSLFEDLAECELARVPENSSYLYLMVEFSNATVALRDMERAALIVSRLDRFADYNAVHVHGFSLGAVSHYLGRALNGTACQAECLLLDVTCGPLDDCCPSHCSPDNDEDCSGACGDGLVDPERGETCEPESDAPCPRREADCADDDPCTMDRLLGSARNCNAQCIHVLISAREPNDGCCPAGADAMQDPDCKASCGNGVRDPREECDGGAICSTSCTMSVAARDSDAGAPDTLCGDDDVSLSACQRCSCDRCDETYLACRLGSSAEANELCSAVLECAERTRCTGDACYCGSAPTIPPCLIPTGPCQREIERAAGTTDPAMIRTLSGDPLTPLGRASAAGMCRVSECNGACFGALQ